MTVRSRDAADSGFEWLRLRWRAHGLLRVEVWYLTFRPGNAASFNWAGACPYRATVEASEPRDETMAERLNRDTASRSGLEWGDVPIESWQPERTESRGIKASDWQRLISRDYSRKNRKAQASCEIHSSFVERAPTRRHRKICPSSRSQARVYGQRKIMAPKRRRRCRRQQRHHRATCLRLPAKAVQLPLASFTLAMKLRFARPATDHQQWIPPRT